MELQCPHGAPHRHSANLRAKHQPKLALPINLAKYHEPIQVFVASATIIASSRFWLPHVAWQSQSAFGSKIEFSVNDHDLEGRG